MAEDAHRRDFKQRFGELDHERQSAQQQNARDEREHQAGLPRLGLLFLGQFARKDRDEDDVVYAQNNFEYSEREKADPDFRLRYPFHNWANAVEKQGEVKRNDSPSFKLQDRGA